MNGNINTEAARPRPLSGGIWTFFSWLRRDDYSLSSESLSSVGSDRTAVSFSFLEPLKYKAATEPILLPPLSPPTDSYKKRLRDRNYRRQKERDITLHRKYGLYKGETSSDRYDPSSLPSARRNISNNVENTERGRRATSEVFQRRAPYVPGKRRAPLPPAQINSFPSNFSRKRPAPKPPNRLVPKDNIKSFSNETMNSKIDNGKHSSSDTNVLNEKKIEKNAKQEKNKSEKNFLKQIFENRKRNSIVETNFVKLLPNISELDEQAAKIIERKKLKLLKGNASSNSDINSITSAEKWICPTCFRKHNTSILSCLQCVSTRKQFDDSAKLNNESIATNIYTQTDNIDLANVASTSKQSEYDEKMKLKVMLKEMKDSLPKKSRQCVTETPTLRIGTSKGTRQDFERKPNNFDKTLDQVKIQLSPDKSVDVMKTNRTLDISVKTNDVFRTSSNGSSTNFPLKSITKTTEFKNSLDKDYKNKELINVQNTVPNHFQKTTGPSTSKEYLIPSQSKHLIETQLKNFSDEKNNAVKTAQGQKLLSNCLTKDMPNVLKGEESDNNKEMLNKVIQPPQFSTKDLNFSNSEVLIESENILNDKPVANAHTKKPMNNVCKLSPPNSVVSNLKDKNLLSYKTEDTEIGKQLDNSKNKSSNAESKLHEPLRISSLLNPVYRPIHSNYLTKDILEKGNESTRINSHKIDEPSTSTVISKSPPLSTSNRKPLKCIKETSVNEETKEEKKYLSSLAKSDLNIQYSTNTSVCKVLGVKPSSSKHQQNNVLDKIDHHSRRRELVNQLEKSIAKGDEQAAADAAVKLAKLRLSCSVLSFSSQIIGNLIKTSNVKDFSVETKENEVNNISQPCFDKTPIQTQIDNRTISQDQSLVKNIEEENTSQSLSSYDKTIEFDNIKNKKKDSTNKNEPCKLKDSLEENKIMSVQIWVEDKEATHGPISISIKRKATIGELRQQAKTSLGLDCHLQRWIIGRLLCLDDTTPLDTLAGPDLSAPFYLCVVESETKKEQQVQVQVQDNTLIIEKHETGDVYTELIKLEQLAIVSNRDAFICEVCTDDCETGKGAILRECLHSFCRDCLSDVVRHCEGPIVSCPTMGCPGVLQDREIRALLSADDYDRWLARGLATAECGIRNAFHCRTRDCTGWAFCEPGVRKFPCPVCKCNNCVPCQAIHEDKTCEQYQLELRTAVTAAQANETEESTQALLNSLIRRGEALTCPECLAIITKKWGCDWVKCSACKTEICWVTRGRRWGPGGRGDTSAGCKCGVDGKRCHPSCGYCH